MALVFLVLLLVFWGVWVLGFALASLLWSRVFGVCCVSVCVGWFVAWSLSAEQFWSVGVDM